MDTCESLCISKIPLFDELSKEDQEKMVEKAEHFEVDKGNIVTKENEKADYILILREGKVKLNTFDIDGKEYILDIKLDRDIIGEEYFLKNTVFTYNVETIEKSKFCKIATDLLFEKAKENPAFSQKMILNLSKELQESNNKLLLMMETNALYRLIGFLLRQKKRLEKDEILLSLDDLAAMINLRKETLSRKIRQLEELGYIERIGHKKIRIIDEKKLEDLLYSI
ncbi:MAG: Crp/Fnr family transcriptional regulator [Peptoniphilaceae bacterium]